MIQILEKMQVETMIRTEVITYVCSDGGGGGSLYDIVLFVHTPLISTMFFFFGFFSITSIQNGVDQ